MRIPAFTLRIFVFPVVFLALILSFCNLQNLRAEKLTPEQIESLRAKLKSLKESLDGHLTTRNTSAGSEFVQAANDPRAAVELYLKCYKTVHFDREGLKESDFRAWKEEESDRLRDPAFVESLQMQLRYLALSCKAAEVEEVDEIFGSLNSYVDSLSKLDEMPDQILTESVAGSVFSQAYYLEKLLGQNQSWEPVPFDIAGIYSKTILPYLRDEKPESLMTAWDKRIEQQTRLVMFLEAEKEKELRGMDRDEKRRKQTRQNRQGGVMGAHDKDDFIRDTLPNLQWSKLKDMYDYVDQLSAAKAMLAFVEEHLTHPKGEEWFNDFVNVINAAESPATEETTSVD